MIVKTVNERIDRDQFFGKDMKKMGKKKIFLVLFFALTSMTAFSFVGGNFLFPKAEGAELIAVMEAWDNVIDGQAMLVCAYDSDEKFNKMRLQGAIPLSTFKDKLMSIEKDQMIIFYCA
jgi:hypothetical protein